MKSRLQQRRLGLCVRAALLGATPMLSLGTAHAATITVDSLADGAPAVDGACTLREAIINANGDADASGGDCAAGDGEDSIEFSTAGTITLSSELPALSDTERSTITGDIGADGTIDVTVSGDDFVRVFAIDNGAGATLSHLAIVNGKGNVDGGGVYNGGELLLSHSIISANYSFGYGGGIFNNQSANLIVEHSTFVDNFAVVRGGGAITSGGTLVISNSTFNGNAALDGTGSGYGFGGAIAVIAGQAEIRHSTIAGTPPSAQPSSAS